MKEVAIIVFVLLGGLIGSSFATYFAIKLGWLPGVSLPPVRERWAIALWALSVSLAILLLSFIAQR